jgi:penicillin-binding protein 1C
VNFSVLFLKKRKKAAAFLILLTCAAWLGAGIWRRATFITPPPTSILTDRNGVFMAQLDGGPNGYGYWPVRAVPVRVADAILALEDKRFWDHPGVDPLAVFRAARDDVSAGRRLSGASTLAMQVARMQHPEVRSLPAKLMEAATALVMTARYGRGGVLKQYLLLVPFGQNSHGIEYAAAWYFDRPVSDLSWAQIAFLSAIPQAPGRYNPGNPQGLGWAKQRAAAALARLRQEQVIDAPTYQEALADLAVLQLRGHPARDPAALHAILHVASITQDAPAPPEIRSTIDLGLEDAVTAIARRRLAQLEPEGARQVAVIIADRASMDVLALVGSGRYGAEDDGEVDYALRWRSPGSTLKPFIFAQALDTGTITPDTILDDAPDSGTGVDNADRRFLGPLLPAQALGNSRNVPAASLVRLAGLARSEAFLSQLGLHDNEAATPYYGLTLAIGGMPTDLARLVAAYGALANDGVFQPLRWYDGENLAPPSRVISLNTARTVTLFLADPMARLPSFSRMGSTEFPFPVAVKTGTSQGYRDGWVVEFTADYVIGVWAGRPDGAPMDELGGAASAALISRDVLLQLYKNQTDGQDDGNFSPPPGTAPEDVCAATGMAGHCAEQLVVYLGGNASAPTAARPAATLRITSPLNHSAFILNPDAPPGLAVLPLSAAGAGGAPLEWFVDGQAYQMAGNPNDPVLWPATPGHHIFQARTPSAASKPVDVMVR